MTCIYNCNNEGKCSMFDEVANKNDNYSNSEYGFDLDGLGTCSVDDDPNPIDNCSMYESIEGDDEDE